MILPKRFSLNANLVWLTLAIGYALFARPRQCNAQEFQLTQSYRASNKKIQEIDEAFKTIRKEGYASTEKLIREFREYYANDRRGVELQRKLMERTRYSIGRLGRGKKGKALATVLVGHSRDVLQQYRDRADLDDADLLLLKTDVTNFLGFNRLLGAMGSVRDSKRIMETAGRFLNSHNNAIEGNKRLSDLHRRAAILQTRFARVTVNANYSNRVTLVAELDELRRISAELLDDYPGERVLPKIHIAISSWRLARTDRNNFEEWKKLEDQLFAFHEQACLAFPDDLDLYQAYMQGLERSARMAVDNHPNRATLHYSKIGEMLKQGSSFTNQFSTTKLHFEALLKKIKPQTDRSVIQQQVVGQKFKGFDVLQWTNSVNAKGNPISLPRRVVAPSLGKAGRSKVMVLSFSNFESELEQESRPLLNRLRYRFTESGLAIINIVDEDSKLETIESFCKVNKLSIPTATVSKSSSLWSFFSVSQRPHLAIIDCKGNVSLVRVSTKEPLNGWEIERHVEDLVRYYAMTRKENQEFQTYEMMLVQLTIRMLMEHSDRLFDIPALHSNDIQSERQPRAAEEALKALENRLARNAEAWINPSLKEERLKVVTVQIRERIQDLQGELKEARMFIADESKNSLTKSIEYRRKHSEVRQKITRLLEYVESFDIGTASLNKNAYRNRFYSHGDYIEDRLSGLFWQKDATPSEPVNLETAMKYAGRLKLGELKSWRLPSKKELEQIFPANRAPFENRAYDQLGINRSAYWTSKITDSREKKFALIYRWHGIGKTASIPVANKALVWCVHDQPNPEDFEIAVPESPDAWWLQLGDDGHK